MTLCFRVLCCVFFPIKLKGVFIVIGNENWRKSIKIQSVWWWLDDEIANGLHFKMLTTFAYAKSNVPAAPFHSSTSLSHTKVITVLSHERHSLQHGIKNPLYSIWCWCVFFVPIYNTVCSGGAWKQAYLGLDHIPRRIK